MWIRMYGRLWLFIRSKTIDEILLRTCRIVVVHSSWTELCSNIDMVINEPFIVWSQNLNMNLSIEFYLNPDCRILLAHFVKLFLHVIFIYIISFLIVTLNQTNRRMQSCDRLNLAIYRFIYKNNTYLINRHYRT